MSGDTKILQSILDGQVSIRKDIKRVEKSLTARIDKIGKAVAYLEDDAPTREEHDELEDRVEKVEVQIASV